MSGGVEGIATVGSNATAPGEAAPRHGAGMTSTLTPAQGVGLSNTLRHPRWTPWHSDISALLFLAVFGGLYWVGVATGYPMYRVWGGVACVGAVGALAVLWSAGEGREGIRRPVYSVLLAWSAGGGLVAGLLSRSLDGCGEIMLQCGAQMEVPIVERAAALWLSSGSPYLPILEMPDAVVTDYNPYSPWMMVFGVPAAVFGQSWWTDMRLWSGLFVVVGLVAAWKLSGVSRGVSVVALRWLAVAPPVALSFASSGVDLPVIVAALLGAVFVYRRAPLAAGAFLGVAVAFKLTAAPIAFVILLVYWARRDIGGAVKAVSAGAAVLAAAYVPVLSVDLEGFMENVIRYTTGSAELTSVAGAPTPGHLLSLIPVVGGTLAQLLLLSTAAVVLVLVLVRPPATPSVALVYAGWCLFAAMLVMPASRIGYIIYPITLIAAATVFNLSDAETSRSGNLPEREAGRLPAGVV